VKRASSVWNHGRRRGEEGLAPLILKCTAKKVVFLVLSGKKILPFFAPLEKFWKNPSVVLPLVKILSTPMFGTITEHAFVWEIDERDLKVINLTYRLICPKRIGNVENKSNSPANIRFVSIKSDIFLKTSNLMLKH